MYFADLAAIYRRRHRNVILILLFSSSSAVVSLLANLPPAWQWVRLALALLTAALTAYEVIENLPEKATVSADLHARWNRLARAYERLWEDMYAADAVETLRKLDEELVALSEASTSLPARRRRLAKWHAHVAAHHRAAQQHPVAAA